MAESKLREALQAIAKAQAASPGAFQDEAGDALKACRLAFLQCRSSPELLDNLQDPPEMVNTLGFLLLSCEKKASRKGQVRECLKVLLERPCWLNAAHVNEEKKIALIEFAKAFPDMADIVAGLEAPIAVEAVRKDSKDQPKRRELAASTGVDADDLTQRLLLDGVDLMSEVDFTYPSGAQTEEKSDRAQEGFSSFYKGATRLRDPGLLKCVSDGDMAQILSFLASTYQHRPVFRAKVLFVVDKLVEMSDAFQKAVSEARLPWAAKSEAPAKPEGPAKREAPDAKAEAPAKPRAPAKAAEPEAVAAIAEAPAKPRALPKAAEPEPVVGPEFVDVVAEPVREYGFDPPVRSLPLSPVPVMSILLPSARKSVVWLDGKEKITSEKAAVLKDAGIDVVGFHDDWKSGESRAAEEALTYIVTAMSSPDESISGVVVNNGPTHKQMLKDVRRFCKSQGRDAPFVAACTMRGTHADFVDCGGVSFIDKDRVNVQKAIVGHVRKDSS